MLKHSSYKQHISAQFNAELESIKNDLLEMGGKVENQIEIAADALLGVDSGLAEEAIAIDKDINRMEVEIDEQCTRILARRQPAASDLRLILAIGKVTTDLERIGDEASKVARLAIQLAGEGGAEYTNIRVRRIASQINDMLRLALDAFARLSVEDAVKVILSDDDVDDDYEMAVIALKQQMRADVERLDIYLNWIWALRSLERIGDHAANIAEQVIYLARGVDIRHQEAEALRGLID